MSIKVLTGIFKSPCPLQQKNNIIGECLIMAYVIYLYEEERYDVCGYYDLDNYEYEEYRIVYEGDIDKCFDFLERM
jgi:hypothetical protein